MQIDTIRNADDKTKLTDQQWELLIQGVSDLFKDNGLSAVLRTCYRKPLRIGVIPRKND